MKRIHLLLVILSSILSGCLDDKNNYDYKEINALKRVENLQEYNTLFLGESRVFEPKVVLTIDSVNPDLSHAWYFDKELVSTENKYEFKAEEIGSFYLFYVATDNKTGVGFPQQIYIDVAPTYGIGWFLLSEKEDGSSQLSVIETRKVKNDAGDNELYYLDKHIDIYPNLGRGPVKLVEHFVNDDYGPLVTSEITVVQKDKMLDLNGNTIEREVYTEEEFDNGAPAGFSPIDAFQTYSSGYILDANGSIYFKLNWIQDAFHTGTYATNQPLFNGKKFSAIYPAKTKYSDCILAVEEGTDQIVGLVEIAANPLYHGHRYNGKMANIVMSEEDAKEDKYNLEYFKDRKVLGIGWHNDSKFLELGQDRSGNYFLHNFEFTLTDYKENDQEVPIEVGKLVIQNQSYVNVFPNGELNDFVDMAVLPYRDYAIFASGNTLYYYEYTLSNAKYGSFKTFNSKITSIAYKDFEDSETHGGAHLGVALEDGSFYILQIDDENIQNSKVLYEADGFGKVVDVIYKINSLYYFDYGIF